MVCHSGSLADVMLHRESGQVPLGGFVHRVNALTYKALKELNRRSDRFPRLMFFFRIQGTKTGSFISLTFSYSQVDWLTCSAVSKCVQCWPDNYASHILKTTSRHCTRPCFTSKKSLSTLPQSYSSYIGCQLSFTLLKKWLMIINALHA